VSVPVQHDRKQVTSRAKRDPHLPVRKQPLFNLEISGYPDIGTKAPDSKDIRG
jgi:hypothetical protein